MKNHNPKKIFRKGSKTYYNSTIFFPKKTRKEITDLYAFVRTVDDFIDKIPQRLDEYENLKKDYFKKNSTNPIVINYKILEQKNKFDKNWTKSFFKSMNMDIKKRTYKNEKEIINYMHGSAEVIGLMMAKTLDLPKKSYKYAMMLGRSMQYINFIRDIKEDKYLKRTYLPENPEKLSEEYANNNQEEFNKIIRKHIKKYESWQKEAEKGFKYIPKKFLIPIQTASEMYKWTAKKIYKEPLIVFKKKVKPSKTRIILHVLRSATKWNS